MKHTVFITGAAGYVGAMLIDQWSKREDVERIIALDMVEPEAFVAEAPKTTWVIANTSDGSWQEQVAKEQPSVVIHAAWQIRNLYHNPKKQWKWNVEGTEAVFDFVEQTPTVKRFIHFSSASVFGAEADNELEHLFAADDLTRSAEYLYALEKREVEEELKKRVHSWRSDISTAIVRPAAISGPRGRFGRIRFGLQSALTGKLKGDFFYKIITLLTAFIPATKKWCRQFIHEDDIVAIVTLLAFEKEVGVCDLYNLTPPGDVVLPKDMAEATGKKVLLLPPLLIRIAFFFTRHLSFGKIPTAAGAWRYYSYPIVMDGTKVTEVLGYTYKYSSKEAFTTTRGHYTHIASGHINEE